MSNSLNQVVTIYINRFEKLIEHKKSFLLCFSGKESDKRCKVIFQTCNYYCGKYQNVLCFCVDWHSYKSKYLEGEEFSLYHVIKYLKGERVQIAAVGYTLESDKLFSAMQKECEVEMRSFSQLKPCAKSDNITGNESDSFNSDAFIIDKDHVSPKRKSRRKTSKHSPEHLAPDAHSSSGSPTSIGGAEFQEYKVTHQHGLKMRISVIRSSRTASYASVSSPRGHSNVSSGVSDSHSRRGLTPHTPANSPPSSQGQIQASKVDQNLSTHSPKSTTTLIVKPSSHHLHIVASVMPTYISGRSSHSIAQKMPERQLRHSISQNHPPISHNQPRIIQPSSQGVRAHHLQTSAVQRSLSLRGYPTNTSHRRGNSHN